MSFEYEEHRNKIDSMSGSTGYRKADRTAGVKQCFVDTIVTETLTQNKDTDMRDTTAANQNNGDDNSDLGAWSSSDEEDDFDEFGPDEEHESDGDPEMLHCLCQLRESSTKSTMVNCDSCHKWYHLTCVNKLAKSLRRSKSNTQTFICPLCQHRRGVPSELACQPPTTARRLGKFGRVSLTTISSVLAKGRELPVVSIPCVNFLACLA